MTTDNAPRLFNDCRFDVRDGSLAASGGEPSVTLRPQAARLLDRFLDQPGEVVDRDSLIAAVWDKGRVVDFESGLAALLRELRDALDEVGAGGELIETVPRRGYRFRGKVEGFARRDTGRGGKRFGLAVMVVLLVLSTALFTGWALRLSDTDEALSPALAIIPFQFHGDAGEEGRRVELLLPDTILARLWQADLEGVELIGRATLKPYEGRDDVAAAVARDLGVQFLIEGTILTESPGQWQINARMLQMPAGKIVWSSTLEWEAQPTLPVSDTADQLVSDLDENWNEIRVRLGLNAVSE